MADDLYDIVVVGFGAAGLAAALSVIETAEEQAQRDFRIAVLERANRDERGGNTRWSTATFRMSDPDTLNSDFLSTLAAQTIEAGDYVRELANMASETLHWAESKGLSFEPLRLYMTTDDARIRPVGAGAAIVEVLGRHLERAERGHFFGPKGSLAVVVEVHYETAAARLLYSKAGGLEGLEAQKANGVTEMFPARAVIFCSGGFQGNPEMMKSNLGFNVPPVSIGGRHNRGEGIEMQLAVGAEAAGQWDEFHPLPVDPRTSEANLMTFTAVMQTVPYSVMVNTNGDRFMDEGADSMDQLYDVVARSVQQQEGRAAFAIFDEKVMRIPGYQTAVNTDKRDEPYRGESIAELAELIGIDAENLGMVIDNFNEHVLVDEEGFDPNEKDGLSTVPGLIPPKSNWSRRIEEAPFFAYPVTCAGVFSFGGIATNARGQVVDGDDLPIPGLFAAGEMTGLYHEDYVGATSVLRSLVFGRIAGREATMFTLAT
jgi:tricarballylate dehydrogenase